MVLDFGLFSGSDESPGFQVLARITRQERTLTLAACLILRKALSSCFCFRREHLDAHCNVACEVDLASDRGT